MKDETPNTTETTPTPTAEWFLRALDAAIAEPEHTRETVAWQNRYIDLWLLFYLHHPDEATPLLREVLPKAKSLSNSDVRVLGQMSSKAFPDASFSYLTFAKSGKVPAKAVRNWFTEVVFPAAGLAWMKSKFGRLVYAGVWTHLKGQEDLCRAGTLAEAVEDCSELVWTWAARPENTLFLLKDRQKTPSRIGSRLKARAALNVGRTWKTLAIRAKKKEPPIIAVDDIEQKPAKGTRSVVLGGTPVDEQKTKTTAMYCGLCKGMKPVLSEIEGLLHLVCGHSRGTNSSEITPAK